jgi:hypothetical protein
MSGRERGQTRKGRGNSRVPPSSVIHTHQAQQARGKRERDRTRLRCVAALGQRGPCAVCRVPCLRDSKRSRRTSSLKLREGHERRSDRQTEGRHPSLTFWMV